MQLVASAICLYDLHGENVLLSGRQIVPVDLECIGRGQLTGLTGPEDPKAVTEFSKEQQNKIGKRKL